MLPFQLVQVVLTESHTEPGMPYPDQQRLYPDHDPPAARVGGPPEIHGHDDEHQRHAHDDSSNLYGRRAEQETEQRNRCQREETRCRPGEEQAGYSSKGRQGRAYPSPRARLLRRERWIQRNGEDQPRGDELWISVRGEGGHLTQRLWPEVQLPREERLCDSEQRDREGRPEH